MISPTYLAAAVNAAYRESDQAYQRQGIAPPQRVYLPKRYGLVFPNVPHQQLGGVNQDLTITANGDFFLCRVAYAANLANAAQTYWGSLAPGILIAITDAGSDEIWSASGADPTYATSFGDDIGTRSPLGKGALGDDVQARVIPGRSSLKVNVRCNEAANVYNVYVTLIGVLVKTWGGDL